MDLINNLGSEFKDVQSARIPSCKSINQTIAGLFVAFDSMKLAEWREDAYNVGVTHELQTKTEDLLTGKFKTVPGRLFTEPRLLIVRGQFLSINKVTRYCQGPWVVDKNMSKDERPDECYKRYLLFFLDPNGLIYHTKPIQLSANGTFLTRFDNNFRDYVSKIFISINYHFGEKLYLQDDVSLKSWRAANYIFEPKFVSKLVGEGSKKAFGCSTEGYGEPAFYTTSLWYKNVFETTVGWWKKSVDKKLLPPSVETSPLVDQEENVVFEDIY